MSDLFISYKKERVAHAERMAVILEAYGYDVWWDYRLILGENFRKTIDAKIDAAKAVIVLWCQASIDSNYVIDEADRARTQGKLLQATIENVDPPLGFRSVDHRISLVGWPGNADHELVSQLITGVASATGVVPVSKPSLLKALTQNLGALPIVDAIAGKASEIAASDAVETIDAPLVATVRELRVVDSERENTFFRSCETADEFEAYLRRYPDGHFAELAAVKIGEKDRSWVERLGFATSDWGTVPRKEMLARLGPRAARAELEPRARRGVPEARTLLGMLAHEAGEFDEASRLYREAAEAGFARAQANLGHALETGRGTAKDETEAIKWYRKAAAAGISFAANNLGRCYSQGIGVTADPAKAAEFFRKAAERGLAMAQRNLGQAYSSGDGVVQDKEEARKWLHKAAEQDDSSAQFLLGFLLSQQKDDASRVEAVQWYKRAADQGSAAAQNNLGAAYELGKGVAQDYTIAREFYARAAEQGNSLSKANLGLLLLEGKGGETDAERGLILIREAADDGQPAAHFYLAKAYERGLGVTADIVEARRLYELAASGGSTAAKSAIARLDKQQESKP